jgi:hypothetical protein
MLGCDGRRRRPLLEHDDVLTGDDPGMGARRRGERDADDDGEHGEPAHGYLLGEGRTAPATYPISGSRETFGRPG